MPWPELGLLGLFPDSPGDFLILESFSLPGIFSLASKIGV